MASSIIALLTDFGTTDPYIGSLKAAIYDVDPAARIVDLCHHVSSQNIREAAFVLRMVYRDYPKGSIFVAVVDPSVGTNRKMLVVKAGGYYFVGPDNGILTYPLLEEKVDRIISIENKKYFRQPISQTFHGRDIFAPCAAALAKGKKAEDFGPILKEKPVQLDIPLPHYDKDDGILLGQVMRTDHFGNLITNIHADDFSQAQAAHPKQAVQVHMVDWTIPLTAYYDHGEEDPLCAVWGSAQFLEIAARKGSAREILDIMPDEPVRVMFGA